MEDLSAEMKITKLKAFVEHWLGPRDESYGVPLEELKPLNLPRILIEFYNFLGRWPEQPLRHQNYLIDPKDMTKERRKQNFGLIEFATENQGVYRWATVADGSDDPAVYSTENWEPNQPRPDWDYQAEPFPGWKIWGLQLTDFLVEFVLTELLARSAVSMPTAFKTYIGSTTCELEILSFQPGTKTPRFALVDKQWLVFDGDGQGWEAIAAKSEIAKTRLKACSSIPTEVTKIKVIFGPTLPLESYANQPWSITVEPDGSAIVHPGIRYFNVGKFKAETFDFQGILNKITPAITMRHGPGASYETAGGVLSGSLPVEYMKSLFLSLIEATKSAENKVNYPQIDLLKAHPPEFIELPAVISENLKQKYPHFEYYLNT